MTRSVERVRSRRRAAAVTGCRALLPLGWLGALFLAAGCDGSGGSVERGLKRLERLAYVPPGECVLPRGAPRAGVDCSNAEPLLFDRYEVTLTEWLEFALAELDGEAPAEALAYWRSWESEGGDRPASWLTREEARRFAARVGMRLPTAAEWMRVAAGTRAQRLPWGQAALSVSNSLDLGLGTTTAVGTFEHGGTLRGVHDLIGNVAEWVEGYLLEGRHAGDERVWAMGGSYLTRERALYTPSDREPGGLEYNAQLFGPGARSPEVGVRLCAHAEDFLLAHAPRWPNDEATRSRLRAVGASWGRPAVPFLEELVGRDGAPIALRALLEGARQ